MSFMRNRKNTPANRPTYKPNYIVPKLTKSKKFTENIEKVPDKPTHDDTESAYQKFDILRVAELTEREKFALIYKWLFIEDNPGLKKDTIFFFSSDEIIAEFKKRLSTKAITIQATEGGSVNEDPGR